MLLRFACSVVNILIYNRFNYGLALINTCAVFFMQLYKAIALVINTCLYEGFSEPETLAAMFPGTHLP